MKLQGHTVTSVDIYQAITWAATFAIKEAIEAGSLNEAQATRLIKRMNTIIDWLGDNKIVKFNEKTGLFEPHDVSEATEMAEEVEDPDVLIIKGD